MYRIVTADAPAYLTDLMPNRVSDMSSYNLKNNQNFPFTRSYFFESSFLPSTLNVWNSLDPKIQSSPSLSQFKQAINHTRKATSFLTQGDRATELALTRIRHNRSSLNADIYRVNIIASPNCTCGLNSVFSEYPLYTMQRNSLFSVLHQFFHPDLHSSINGNELYKPALNSLILFQVFKFIKESK